jgi:hypothetical protein
MIVTPALTDSTGATDFWLAIYWINDYFKADKKKDKEVLR